MSGVGGDGAITGCGSKYEIEGVAFRPVKLEPSLFAGVDQVVLDDLHALLTRTTSSAGASASLADLSLLRSRLAHLCLGTDQRRQMAADPLARTAAGASAYGARGALDALAAAGKLMSADVALALIFWTANGIGFVDMWSVRRRPAAPSSPPPWTSWCSERRASEAETVWLQFQDHFSWLQQSLPRGSVTLASLSAADYFRYLPPAGMVPIVARGSTNGVDQSQFFGVQPATDPVLTDGNLLRPLFEEALSHEPIDLTQPDQRIQRYRIHENRPHATLRQAVVVFASRTLAARSVARYGTAQMGRDRFVPTVT